MTKKYNKRKEKQERFKNIFRSFDNIVDLYECDYEINIQDKISWISDRQHKLSDIIRKDQTKRDLTNFLLAACYSPVCLTLLSIIKNHHFTTWLGMEHNFMKRRVTYILPSAKGHLNQKRQGFQSTKIPKQEIFEADHATILKHITNLKKQAPPTQSLEETIVQDIQDEAFPPSESPNLKKIMLLTIC